MLDATDLDGGAGDIEVVRVLRDEPELGRHVGDSSDLRGGVRIASGTMQI